MPLSLDDLAHGSGEWLRGSGPESDIVVSSRIRLARNLADFPFIARATSADRGEVETILHERVKALHEDKRLSSPLLYVDVSDLEELDRQFLVERQLISREHADSEGARAVAIDGGEQFSVMINEEDHLRIQVMRSGLDLSAAWQAIN
ncbi:MAG: ATP--guanido phosphotransferase, partial [Planctomycetota bacterium]